MDQLTDAPVANILMLAGIIFLAVGLFGRIGGFIGSIFGNIEAGKNARVLAGVFGVVLIGGGAWLHEIGDQKTASPATTSAATTSPTAASAQPSQAPSSTPSAPPQASPAAKTPANLAPSPAQPGAANQIAGSPFVGKWTNETPGPDRLHWFQIEGNGQGLTIHLWAACAPADCDNGTYSLNVSGQTATYTLGSAKKSRVGKMTMESPSRLHLTVDLTKQDSHATKQFDWTFVKSN